MPSPSPHRIRRALVALACVVFASCGGGGEGEVGSGGTGAALGTVTGFGSIFVDGVRFDDSNAEVQIDNLAGKTDPAEAKLGQRVAIEFETDGVARTVHIEPEAVGLVTSAPTGTGFSVLGQSIVVNGDPTVAPVTQFDGDYSSLTDVHAGDRVEVHGVRLAGDVIQATRIEKLAALNYLRVVGVVKNLATVNGAPQFALGALTVNMANALTLPLGRALAEGQSVVVWAGTGDLQSAGAGAPILDARLVRIRARSEGRTPAYVGGAVSNLVGTTFNLGDVVVHGSGATISGGSLNAGQYVQVRGDFAADGSLNATTIKIRDGQAPDAELRGTVVGYDAAAHTFKVRDVNVDASAATLAGCPTSGLSDGQFVDVKGHVRLTGIVATSVQCSDAPAGAIIERTGVANNVAALLKTFTLTTATGPVSVRWTVLTFFRDVLPTPLSLEGASGLRVEGVFNSNGVLVATKIRLDN